MRCTTEHRGQRDSRLDRPGSADHLHAFDTAAARVQVTDDRAHELLGDSDLDIHHGLKQNRLFALRAASLKAIDPAILNAISFESTSSIASVVQRHLDVDHLVTGKHGT